MPPARAPRLPFSPATTSDLEAMFRRMAADAIDEALRRQAAVVAGAAAAPLAPAAFVFPSALVPAQTIEGSAVWDSNDDVLTVGTGTGRKTLANVGDAPATHGASAHTGDVLPDASDQTLGAGTLSIAEQAAPSNPAAGTRKVYVDSTTHKLSVRTSAGTSVSLEEQATTGLVIQEVDGAPTNTFTTLKVSNGTLTDNGDGSATVTTGGGGGSGNVISTGAAGSEPGSPASGDLYLPNNGFALERYNGSAWVPWGPLFPFTKPAAVSGFTWVNQGTVSVSESRNAWEWTIPGTVGGTNNEMRLLAKSAPATPWTVTLYLKHTFYQENYRGFGLYFRESSSGKLQLFALFNGDAVTRYIVRKHTDPTTFSADYVAGTNAEYLMSGGGVFLRIGDDGTNRTCWTSRDGQNWLQLHTIGRTDFLTANQYGIGAWLINTSSNTSYATVPHLAVG